MGVPSPFAQNPVPFERFISAKEVFHRTRHHMMDPRSSVCRWRAFLKGEGNAVITGKDTFGKNIVFFPPIEDIILNLSEIKMVYFFKFLIHKKILYKEDVLYNVCAYAKFLMQNYLNRVE